ncbi:unnamed protein product [Gordionus sp. m RMFG-2023]|uniref:CWF19-like protein 2 n=1 Tax=Gordionus sp. m RMFG-2023 TaxID=3053472 RepID=UPI0030E2EB0F
MNDYEEVWVEKEDTNVVIQDKSSPKDYDEDCFSSLIGRYSTLDNKQDRSDKKKLKDEEIEKVRQSRELNPYFKNPCNKVDISNKTNSTPSIIIGDGGASWLRKSFKRAKEQSVDTGRPLQEIIAERWGSLEKFKKLLEEAEKKEDVSYASDQPPSRYIHNKHGYSKYDKLGKKDKDLFIKPTNDTNYILNKSLHQQESSNLLPENRTFKSAGWKKNKEKLEVAETPNESSILKNIHTTSKNFELNISNDEAIVDEIKTTIHYSNIPKSGNSFFDLLSNKVTSDLRLHLLELNKIAAEYMRYYIKCEISIPGNNLNNASLDINREGMKQWGSLLEKARDKYLSQPNDHKNTHDNSNFNERQHNRNSRGMGGQYSNRNAGYNNNRQNHKKTFANAKAYANEYENGASDQHFDIRTGEFVSGESKRQKLEMDNSIKVQRDTTILNYKQAVASIEKCKLCFDSPQMIKHSLVTYGTKSYIALPDSEPLVPYECYISPMNHITSMHDLEDDCWNEMQKYMEHLSDMLATLKLQPIFLYGCLDTKKFYHTRITCVPVPKKLVSQIPMYFKKAISEAEYEWSDNKKLIDMKHHLNPSRVVPKNLPYFAFAIMEGDKSSSTSVSHNNGYAHIIENRAGFPHYFGKEVLGGILEITDTNLWRKPRHLSFEQLSKSVVEFMGLWKPFEKKKI